MAGTKTNSNSITAILINKLNYKKSGFRAAMLDYLGKLPNDTVFMDGTHSTINLPEIGNKEVDIVGISDSKYVILLEIKANLSEDIQESQKAGGEYVTTAEKNKIKLKYIIPDGYYEAEKLPKDNDFVQIIKWSEIYDIAKTTDNTGFTQDIDYFVESNFASNDLLLNKGEVAMFLSPNEVKNVITLEAKIEILITNFIKTKKDAYQFEKKDLWGFWIRTQEKRFWIGFYNLKEAEDYFFFIYSDNVVKKENIQKYQNNKDYWLYQKEIYIPILAENKSVPTFLFEDDVEKQQNNFNELIESNIKKFFEIVE